MIAERGAFPVVLGLEARKLARAMVTRVATLAGLVLVTVATAGGYAAAMHAGDTDLGRKAASMVTSPGWDGYTALGATSVSATTLLAVGVVMSWSVGREFTDGTMVGLFAVPPTLRSIAAAKMVATLSWAALLGVGEAAMLTTAGLMLGLGCWRSSPSCSARVSCRSCGRRPAGVAIWQGSGSRWRSWSSPTWPPASGSAPASRGPSRSYGPCAGRRSARRC